MEASPDSVFFDGFRGSGPGFFTGCPHLAGRPGTPKRAGRVVMTGRLICSLPGGPPRDAARPVLPHAPVARQGIGDHDGLPHDRGHGDPVDFSSFPEAAVKRRRRHIEDVPRPPPSAANVAPALQRPAVTGEGSHADQGGGLAVADRA